MGEIPEMKESFQEDLSRASCFSKKVTEALNIKSKGNSNPQLSSMSLTNSEDYLQCAGNKKNERQQFEEENCYLVKGEQTHKSPRIAQDSPDP